MNNVRLCGIIGLAISIRLAGAGELPTETFSHANAGWQDRDPGKMIVSQLTSGGNPGGCLRLVFPAQSVAFPDTDAAVATGQMASAQFTGDYLGAEAMMLGFDFKADHVLPSSLWIKLYSSSNVIYRDVTSHLNVLNAWQPIRVSILSSDLGGWLGDVDAFFDVVRDVVRVEFQLTRQSEITQMYYLDNIFLDRLPEATPVAPDEDGAWGLTWRNLRVGDAYRVEAAGDLASPVWRSLGSFTAADQALELRFQSTNDVMFYRMSLD